MRVHIKLVFCFILFTAIGNAQNSPDCRSAIPVCGDAPIVVMADGSGDIDDFDPDVIRQTGCLEKGSNSSANIENNTSWFAFRALSDGRIGFDLEATPVAGNATITAEWDFAVYGPDTDCVSISNGTAQPIRCNYEVNPTPFTGLGVNPETGQAGHSFVKGSQNTYDDWLDIVAGEIYYILINNYNTNFDGDPESYTLTFTGEADALDCTFRDEFLGLDIIGCEGDPDIVLSALRSPAGPDVASVTWSVDYDDDGVIDVPNIGSGTEYTVASPNSGRYFVEITTASGMPPTVVDDGGILILFHAPPNPADIEILVLDYLVDRNRIEVVVNGNSSYEYAINGGDFQDDPIFNDVPPGQNTLIVNDKNNCGITDEIPFLVIGYPKFFTPNQDGVHDTWNILGIEELIDPKVYIFDRYGKLLKQLNANSSWNGTFNGKKMPESDYWFRMEYAEDEQTIIVAKTLQNHFTLKR
ncbi:T9SS type B sorting domain-containing protein [Cellulophaga sp. F20128]|uniref:T9SS type B sorting domain-containing protein n=1 Tax=Cellulophaga sp. F20128 TaxID=2926413 RepID=UPI001FF5C3BE|nr:T9SS type B sorting domain-containing protein [Cellulophaga sp. F20128]MCK0156407.1 T9SS type B sorting domain-containing protein [Cellulophaga sp. F20128]